MKVYRNGTLLTTVDVSAWPYYADGGYIGVWIVNASGARLDDFGGGTSALSLAPNSTGEKLAGGMVGRAVVAGCTHVQWTGKDDGRCPALLKTEQLRRGPPQRDAAHLRRLAHAFLRCQPVASEIIGMTAAHLVGQA
ncbi:MAG: hypothetical protein IH586_03000 [Anaerolineaceae bacterium]|nr:hypothetical protein [Anaerolineaceae bacterium]